MQTYTISSLDNFTLFYMKKDEFYYEFVVYQYLDEKDLEDLNLPIVEFSQIPSHAELYAHGQFRKDGITHLWFGSEIDDSEGYFNFTSSSEWDEHIVLLQSLKELSYNLFTEETNS